MLNKFCLDTNQSLRSRFINKLRNKLFDRDDFTQGEFIDALDQVREDFQQDPTVNHEQLNEIVKSLTSEWRDIGEIIRTDNQNKRVHQSLALVIGGTALVTAILSWFIFRKK